MVGILYTLLLKTDIVVIFLFLWLTHKVTKMKKWTLQTAHYSELAATTCSAGQALWYSKLS